ncbi:MAG: hypothetical protein K0S34_2342 [Bacillales bacterium]|nr:hypothetical protein [Bacillales bacterium]
MSPIFLGDILLNFEVDNAFAVSFTLFMCIFAIIRQMEDKTPKVEDKLSELEDKMTKLEDKSFQLEDKVYFYC